MKEMKTSREQVLKEDGRGTKWMKMYKVREKVQKMSANKNIER